MEQYRRLRDGTTLETVSFGWFELTLFPSSKLEEEQLGYAVGADGEDFTGTADGDWRAEWLVIGRDGLVGDPIFIDLGQPRFPVFTAPHGQGRWVPLLVAESFAGFVEALELIEAASRGWASSAEDEENPFPDEERRAILEQIAAANPGVDLDFWEEAFVTE